MHIYQISPELFRNSGGFDDEFDSWMNGCFQSKWDNRIEKKAIELEYDATQHLKEINLDVLKGD